MGGAPFELEASGDVRRLAADALRAVERVNAAGRAPHGLRSDVPPLPGEHRRGGAGRGYNVYSDT